MPVAGTNLLSKGSRWLSEQIMGGGQAALGAGWKNTARAMSIGGQLVGMGGPATGGRAGFSHLGMGAQRAIVGGTLGGIYGAFADDTSVLGGAAIGAGIGGGSRAIGNLARTGSGAYRRTRGLNPGLGKGRALANTFAAMGNQSKNYIKNTYTQAVNKIEGLAGF